MLRKPKLRLADTQWIMHNGQPALLLRDPLGLTEQALVVPQAIALLLALCDGTRDLDQLRTAFELRHGIPLTVRQLEKLVSQLDDALLLDSPRYTKAYEDALADYRNAPYRQPALAGRGYPSDPEELHLLLDNYVAAAYGPLLPRSNGRDSICGLVSPHIDYQRGGEVYAKAWLPVADAVAAADLVIVLGTDHSGGLGDITLTRQHYATPWGVIPTAQHIVDALASAIGEQRAFDSELHHRHEHSIELAVVWMHYLLGSRAVEMVPVLCGSFHHYVHEQADPVTDERRTAFVNALRQKMVGRRTLIVAAADLAHVGPAFGDASPYGDEQCHDLHAADTARLAAAASGDPEVFFEPIRQERDRHRICGLPPIYHMLHLLDGAFGEVTGYAQCPADDQGHSWVSVGGIVYRRH